MSAEDALIHMFTAVHGEMTGACYIEVSLDENGEPNGIDVMKHGNLCWNNSKLDILFDFITMSL